ncbi:serine/threonine protein kinase [Ectobacillus panaciterrae]|uniref:serine/threonine protein kinase n=1 Tax=Ectobacillus panaciterrae TaxID=363872 RepID=UPI003CCB8FF3
MLEHVIALFDRPLRAGTILHNYRIESILGMGSYGFTYLVTDLSSTHQKVVKQLRKSKQRLQAGRKSFAYEKQIMQKLRHSSIPKLLDVFEWKRQPFYVMEYIRGKTFEELIFEDQKTYTEQEAFTIVLEILQVVSYLHEQGIVHRDLRIPNILIENQTIYVIDFGLARYIGERDEREDTFLGEKKYMREIHYRSDFYALGHFLLFLLYSAYAPTTKEERPWYEELTLTPQGCHILKRMLQIDNPYQNAKELCEDIQFLLKEWGKLCSKSF